ncbi:MAG: alpha-L-fucosidase [Paludibacter sp.]|nr:alpha-L-fucosidase [Paludibacter sp.]
MKKHSLLFLCFCASVSQLMAVGKKEFLKNKVIPTENQIRYQQQELVAFVHFTTTTFYNKEWGNGDEDPKRFNPYNLNAEQWAQTAKNAGVKELILTTKHHDGFCLWPSKYTEHSIKNSPYKNGKGDIVREFVDACHKYGIKVGMYLSPWDRNHKDYGRKEYIDYFKNQLTEILTNYGKVSEIWFDGANGGDGYYGGAREKRIIGNDYYPWAEFHKIVKTLQPDCQIFSDNGPDIRWVGNEKGYCGETFWSTINRNKLRVGNSDPTYLNIGETTGSSWLVGQCDVSIRPGWFFHSSENNQVRTPSQIVDLYYKSVGRNGVLLINLPPDSTGLIHKTDSTNFVEFKKIIDESFKNNLALGSTIKTSSKWSKKYRSANINDNITETFWAASDKDAQPEIVIDLKKEKTFNRISISEPIAYGQRVAEFQIEVQTKDGWQKVASATTIGYKRLLRINKISASKIKIKVKKSAGTAAISEVGLFLASEKE